MARKLEHPDANIALESIQASERQMYVIYTNRYARQMADGSITVEKTPEFDEDEETF